MPKASKPRRLKYTTNLDPEVAEGVETVATTARQPVAMLLRNIISEWWETRHASSTDRVRA
jgi:hypothetical protein